MSRKDYQAQAAMIKSLRDLGYDEPTLRRVADELADIAAQGNDRFDRARFMIAAGMMMPARVASPGDYVPQGIMNEGDLI